LIGTDIPLVAPVADEWPESRGSAGSELEELLFASHLLGANRAISNFGGGNTSAKGVSPDHAGRQVQTLWVKGSGSDLATMRAQDFTPLQLDDILPLIERPEMSDEEMVAFLSRCQLDPGAPRSSIETLLHAFIPAPHVHHTHPDAINALACADGGQELVRECFGDEVAWIEYIRPGFTLAKQVGEAVRANPELKLVVLAKHGLVVWGDSARSAYEATVRCCNRAAEFVNTRFEGSVRFGGAKRPTATHEGDQLESRRAILTSVMPALRGAVSVPTSKVLMPDLSTAVCEFVDSADAPALTSVGAACPDHLVHTKRVPLWVPFEPESDTPADLSARVVEAVQAYREQYERYFVSHADSTAVISDPNPRVVLIQNVGMVTVGRTVKAAQISRDLYYRAIEVMAGANAVSRFVSLTEAESFAVEYWPLELYKLSLAPPPRELEGKVALVTGAAGGIGRAIMSELAAAGACVVGFDLDADGVADAVEQFGATGVGVSGDVTDETAVEQAFAAAVGTFGGVDAVISNAGIASSARITETTLSEWHRNQEVLGTGYFLVAREAFKLLEQQDQGGSIVFIASKNSLVAGPNASAYSSAKALELHLARCLAAEGGASGIRVNTVNPDAVLSGSRIWDGSWRNERAAAYGISPDQLEEHYRSRTMLGVNILPQDIAHAVLHFVSDARSGKSTGNVLNVDGGVAAAFPR
jgi:rhamnulose-1-phosphate aldolase/alcohol dehydrogenase